MGAKKSSWQERHAHEQLREVDMPVAVTREVSEKARRVHKEAIVIDTLQIWFGKKSTEDVREYIKVLIDSGVTAAHVTVAGTESDLPAAITEFAQFYKLVEGVEKAKIALSAADIESAKKEGTVAIVLGMQECMPFERDLDLLRIFYKLGLRIAMPAYSRQTMLGTGCAERVDAGLTDLGREAVKEMNRLGILLDACHCSDKTARETAEASEVPISLTHAGSATLVPIPRAKSDETIKAIAEKGGFIGQNFERPFGERPDKPGPRPTLSQVIDMLDHLVNVAGVDHVGLGIDYCPFQTGEEFGGWFDKYGYILHPHQYYYPYAEMMPEELVSMRGMIYITEELLRRGYSDEATKKILGGNFVRLLKDVLK